MAKDDDSREQGQPSTPHYDRFGFEKWVGSYRETDRTATTAHWSRPWTQRRS